MTRIFHPRAKEIVPLFADGPGIKAAAALGEALLATIESDGRSAAKAVERASYGPGATVPAAAVKGRIRTHWGTAIFAENVINPLRHGPADAVPPNVLFAVHDGDAYLLHVAPDGTRYTIQLTPLDGTNAEPQQVAPQAFQIIPAEKGIDRKFGLRALGYYVCAEPDGRVTLSRSVLGPWEKFELLGSG